ncbi:MAG: hypothetical protein VKO00_00875 [Cyanobacteriota bacterium]|nr:hypothetical protein [Cyanobacteriota bacterium]
MHRLYQIVVGVKGYHLEAQRVSDFVFCAINALERQSERLDESTFLFASADVLLSRG